MLRYPKGVAGRGRYFKRMRHRVARSHRRWERSVVRRAFHADNAYGTYTAAHSAYGEYRGFRRYGRRWAY
jgi:hypothetical protein